MTATPIHDELVDALRRRADEPVETVIVDGATTVSAVAVVPALDDAARTALALAREEAVAGGRARWGTGHLLLGLLRGDDAVADLLHAAGASTAAARRSVVRYENSAAGGDDDTVAAASDLCSPAAATVLDAAQAAAWSGHRATVGSADLLAALLDAPAGAAAGVLASLAVPHYEIADAARTLAARPVPEIIARRWRDPSRLLRKRA